MHEKSDAQLLRDYAERANEAAFREIVNRHAGLVYASALRQVTSPDLARDVAQSIFTDLARKAAALAGTLTENSSLLGWLYRSTRFTALNLMRDDRRRLARERQVMEHFHPATETTLDWDQVQPVLDEAMADLSDEDRDALLLRFFKNHDFRAIGSTLGVSDAAAQKRVSRALERLRTHLTSRGVTTSAVALSTTLSANAAPLAPAGLAATLSTGALAGATLATTATATVLKTIAITTLQKTLITATVAVLAGVGVMAIWPVKKGADDEIGVSRPQSTNETVVNANTRGSSIQQSTPASALYESENITAPASFVSVHVSSLNNRGQIAGWLDESNRMVHAFVWDNGVMSDLGTLGGSKAVACSINDLGEIAAVVLTNGERRLFLLQGDRSTDLGAIDGFDKLGTEGKLSYAPSVEINNQSEITGRLTVEDGNQRSFLFRQGQVAYFGLRGDGRIIAPRAMNNRGGIAGVTIPGNEDWGVFFWQDGIMTDLETLGGSRAGVNAINDHGTLVGWADPAGTAWERAHAIVWENGKLRDLHAAGWKTSRATGINNAGDIVGWATTIEGRSFAFLKRGDDILDLNTLVPTNSGWRLLDATAINDRGQILAVAWKGKQSRSVLLSPHALLPVATTASAIVAPPAITAVAPARLNITSFERRPDGTFQLRFSGKPDIKYVIEASTNLATWTLLGEAMNRDGSLTFIDHEAPKFSMRFYRITQQ